MKHVTNKRQCRAKALLFSAGVGLIMTQVCFAAKTKTHVPGEDEPAKKAKMHSSRSLPTVRIYPDAMKKTMHVIAKRTNGKFIDFFVFDMEGNLMQNYKMKARDHMRIVGLKKGSYVYRVFCGDEETAAGNFEIR